MQKIGISNGTKSLNSSNLITKLLELNVEKQNSNNLCSSEKLW